MERVSLPDTAHFSAVIDYAHTPDALKNLLESIRASNPEGRIVLLFGCGGDRDSTKRSVMGKIASSLADHVIVTSDNSRSESTDSILREIIKGIDFSVPCTVILDRAKAITYAVQTAQKGDVLVLAGKGHEEYEIGKDGKKPFSERRIVQTAYQNKIECEERDVLP